MSYPLTILLMTIMIVYVYAGKDYYQLLGVSRDASDSEIKKRYYKLGKVYHPDKHKGDEETQEKYKEITNAYSILSDKEKRRKYDMYGEDGLNEGRGSRDPFGFMNRRSEPSGPPRSPNVVIDIDATLEDLYNGKEFEILQRRQILCPRCRGSGAKNPNDVKTCSTCGGSGVRVVTQRLGPGFVTKTQTTCDKCNGKGKTSTTTCPYCSGKKVSHGDQLLKITIERGMNEGHEIVMHEEGDEHPDRLPGDLILRINTPEHRRFTRIGPDLYMEYSISLIQALTGFSKTFKHLDGHEVTITQDTVTKPGQILSLTGEGMPLHGDPSSFGDLHITFSIRFPETLTPSQKTSIKEILS